MPEGHVIHRLARDLTERFGGGEVQVSSPQGRFAEEAAVLDGRVLDGAEAWGKHLFIGFGDLAVHIHLGLIGTFRFGPADPPTGQVRLRLSDGETAADLRGPQWCRLVTEADRERAVAALGADPLRAGDGAAPQRLREWLGRTRRSIASVLMDQSFYAGVGNIYRAEVLFRQGIDPATPASALTPGQVDAVWEDLVELMGYGVEAGRIDTVRPEHTPEAMGRPPRRDDHGGEVYVYRREGLPCLVCGTPVRARDLEGRTLFWCPTCQPPL
ncbi:DNA-formamidopyrimidine glycosylase family protein [Corynebacterium bovis]|uniref:Fpg/Nei family DNA glycosylase n=1 Tax=Corynebacterium bovis TaxID=36808 RepID=UPI002448FE78|nr:DNA-formamidopyrimidine glycosylase family protein [Corynebacterium bovis]MDH2456552.1 DNA-formamidopyrimidine glycosylase family protein [Corynebacterium bovis]